MLTPLIGEVTVAIPLPKDFRTNAIFSEVWDVRANLHLMTALILGSKGVPSACVNATNNKAVSPRLTLTVWFLIVILSIYWKCWNTMWPTRCPENWPHSRTQEGERRCNWTHREFNPKEKHKTHEINSDQQLKGKPNHLQLAEPPPLPPPPAEPPPPVPPPTPPPAPAPAPAPALAPAEAPALA